VIPGASCERHKFERVPAFAQVGLWSKRRRDRVSISCRAACLPSQSRGDFFCSARNPAHSSPPCLPLFAEEHRKHMSHILTLSFDSDQLSGFGVSVLPRPAGPLYSDCLKPLELCVSLKI